MTIYITGDIHGNPVERFSYKHWPESRQNTEKDIVIICGDIGLPFGNYNPEQDYYNLNWLGQRKETFLLLCGNHDDRNAIRNMPRTSKFGANNLRQVSFQGTAWDNLFYIDEPTILNIPTLGRCLFIPGAESHDIQDGILDPDDPEFAYKKYKLIMQNKCMFRIKNQNWWPDEVIDIDATSALLDSNNEPFAGVFTHECPGGEIPVVVANLFHEEQNEGQQFLESLRQTLDFEFWFHGHMHYYFHEPDWDSRIVGIYHDIIQLD